MILHRAHQIRLDPSPEQEQAFKKACGVARYAYNWALNEYKKSLDLAKATGSKPAKLSDLKKQWNSEKATLAPWAKESPKDANQQPFTNLQKALSTFYKSRKAGAKTGFPTWKRKGKSRDSFYCSNDKVSVTPGEFNVRLPVIGWVRTLEKFTPKSTTNPHIQSVVVGRQGTSWYASVSYECEVADVIAPEHDDRPICAVDLGLRTFATILDTDGVLQEIQAPQSLKAALKKLRKTQQAMSRCATSPTKKRNKRHQVKRKSWKKKLRVVVKADRRKRLAARRLKAQNLPIPVEISKMKSNRHLNLETRLAKLHERAANVRKDFLHKPTTRLLRENQAVIIEDLSVTGMISNRKWARKVADLGLRNFRTLLEYKHVEQDSTLFTVSRWFASSKTCSACGHKHADLKLEKIWVCPVCGAEHVDDVNAVINMLDLYFTEHGFGGLSGFQAFMVENNRGAFAFRRTGGGTVDDTLPGCLGSSANDEAIIQSGFPDLSGAHICALGK